MAKIIERQEQREQTSTTSNQLIDKNQTRIDSFFAPKKRKTDSIFSGKERAQYLQEVDERKRQDIVPSSSLNNLTGLSEIFVPKGYEDEWRNTQIDHLFNDPIISKVSSHYS